MTVAELKALAPLADVYELRSDAQYLIVLPYDIDPAVVQMLINLDPKKFKVRGAIVQLPDPELLRIFDMGKE